LKDCGCVRHNHPRYRFQVGFEN